MEFDGDTEKFARGNDEIEIHDHTKGGKTLFLILNIQKKSNIHPFVT